jgi:predicted NodU family carbamoyl transferase
MSIEMDFREVVDAAAKFMVEVDKSREANTNERPDLFAFYLGSSMATAQKLKEMLMKMAEHHVYNKVDCPIFMADTMTDSRCIHCGKTRAEHNPGVHDG